jgi:cytosine permease
MTHIPPARKKWSAGIMIAEYYIVKRWRGELAAAGTALPATEPTWVPATLVVWLISSLVGGLVPFGVGALNPLILSVVLYALAGWAGLVRPVSIKTIAAQAPANLVAN